MVDRAPDVCGKGYRSASEEVRADRSLTPVSRLDRTDSQGETLQEVEIRAA